MVKFTRYELNTLRKSKAGRLQALTVMIRVKQSARLLDPEEGDTMLL